MYQVCTLSYRDVRREESRCEVGLGFGVEIEFLRRVGIVGVQGWCPRLR